ncbi:MAG: flagellar hook assembly protein FlgD, partial [Armatimonadota bacterium]
MFHYVSAVRRYRSAWLPAVCLVALMVFSTQALANVYATRLEMSAPAFAPGGGGTVTLSFILNENAGQGVTLKIYRANGDQLVRAVNLGPLARGTHTWVWDGKNDGGSTVPLGEPYYFTVTASDYGHSQWTPIIDETITDRCKYYSPRGVDVNKDPASKYYGRVYVSEAIGSGANTWSGSPKVTQDGIYILNADCTDAVGQGDNSRTGGVAWITSGTANSYSPFRCTVGPDDCLYVCDDADPHPGLWVGDPDFLSAQSILDPAGADSTGLTTNHGNIISVMPVGIGPDRVIYTMDEDYPGNVAQKGSIWQYNIGNSALPWWAKPDAIPYNDSSPNIIQNYYNDFTRDSVGDWYICQNRFDGTDISSVIKVAADQTIMFRSLNDYGGRDVLRNAWG